MSKKFVIKNYHCYLIKKKKSVLFVHVFFSKYYYCGVTSILGH